MPTTLAESTILRTYAERTPRSRALYERARRLLPNGVTHVGRYLEPHPVYVSHARGSRKWDADGNEYVDYFGGHGALLAGHNHPAVVEAVQRQVARGAHYGASHELEVEWAELIRELVPSAEAVRFTVTGTEATLLGLRMARAFTGRGKVLRFATHFHGWHDHVSFPAGGAPGIVPGIVEDVLICPPNDVARARELLDANEVAAVILEPTGATFGHVPTPPEFLHELRAMTESRGVLLFFDEVISGFRVSPGGAQGLYGIRPDLTSLAKIVAGGYPGAAIVGRADVLSALAYTRDDGAIRSPRVVHQGTYNAGPVSAAAGIATLKLVRDTDLVERAKAAGAAIRAGMSEVIARKGVNWCVYGRFSDFHLFASRKAAPVTAEDIYAGRIPFTELKGGMPAELVHKMRTAFLTQGVDIVGWPGGLVSGVHTDADVDATVTAFGRVLDQLGEEGEL